MYGIFTHRFTINLSNMWVNIPYMEHFGIVKIVFLVFCPSKIEWDPTNGHLSKLRSSY